MEEYKNLLIPKLGMMAKSVRIMQDSKLNSQNITAKQAMTLGYIVMKNNRNCAVNQKDIEKQFHLTASTVTSLIEKLEKACSNPESYKKLITNLGNKMAQLD